MSSPDNTASPFGVRSLAAVMFTDVVNFSGLIGEREDRTLRLVQRDLDRVAAAVAEGGGRVIKTMGDGTLCYFDSAVNAVGCARQLQSEFARRHAGAADSLRHRIGIHLGDVFVLENDVLGNSVNIAARLLTCAQPGGICFSQTVYDVVKNRMRLQIHYIGPQELKHIREAVPAYMVPAEACLTPAAERVAIESPARPARAGAGAGAIQFAGPTLRMGSGEPFSRHTPAQRALLVIADLSARPGPRDDPPREVDVDNFDDVFRGFGVRLALPLLAREGTAELTFAALDDFHPDRLAETLPPLRELCQLRAALTDSRTGPAALAHLRTLFPPAGTEPRATETPSPRSSAQELVARLLKDAARPSAGKPGALLDPLLAHRFNELAQTARLSPAAATGVAAALAEIDRECARELRAVLHHPDFQRLEATWLAIKRLVEEHGDGRDVKLFLLDRSRQEIAAPDSRVADLIAATNPALIVADYFLGEEIDDFGWLSALGHAALATGAAVYAGARPIVAGCESLVRETDPSAWNIALPAAWSQTWRALRASPAGRRIALVAPRYLARQPYGKGGEKIAPFAFEELPDNRAHESYLWANGAFVGAHCAAVLLAEGPLADALPGGELTDLPWSHFLENGEKRIVPCAEVRLTERALQNLAARGLTGLLSIADRNAVRIEQMVPIAGPRRGGA